MGKFAFPAIRLPGSLWGRLPRFLRLFEFCGIWLVFCLLVFTPFARADLSDSAAPLSLRPIPLQISCHDFWTSDWQSGMIYRQTGATFYNPLMHSVALRFDYGYWNAGSPSTAAAPLGPDQAETAKPYVEAMQSARQSAGEARAALAKETGSYQKLLSVLASDGAAAGLRLDMSTMSLCNASASIPFGQYVGCIPAAAISFIEFIGGSDIPAARQFPPAWNSLMSKTISTFNGASTALNGAFLSAQGGADTLHMMGADDPAYRGAAVGAWGEWASFVTEANAWSSGPSAGTLQPHQSVIFHASGAGLNTTGGHYAQAYRVLRRVEELCNNPSDPMPFDDRGSIYLTVNDMLADGDQSLWARAWALQGRLQAAAEQMESEMQDNKSAADAQIAQAKAALDDLRAAGWSDDLSEAPLSDYNASAQAQASAYAGTYSETSARASDALETAVLERNSGDTARSQSGRIGYAVRAMGLYAQASADAASACAAAQSLLSGIRSRTGAARTLAQTSISTLSAAVDARPGGMSGSQAASLRDARNSLDAANAEFLAGERSTAPGARMSHYLAALSSSRTGLRLLNPSNQAGPDLFEMRRLLETYKTLMDWALALGVDVSVYEPAYGEYLAEVNSSNPNPKPGSLEGLKIQLNSLRHGLLQALDSESAAYGLLLQQAEALPYRTHAADALRAEMAKWRGAQDWSDEALAHPEQMRAQLAASRDRLHALTGQVISEDICSPELAAWMPYRQADPIAGQRLQVGGVWASRNPLPLEYDESLTADCPFDVPFYSTEKPGLSGPVQKAWANGGQLHLVLNPLGPSEEVSVNFSSMQEPFHLAQTGCLLALDENRAVLRANYTLKSDYPASSVAVNVPWESPAAPGSARLQAQGLWTDGIFIFNSVDSNPAGSTSFASTPMADWALSGAYAHFLLSGLPAPAKGGIQPAPLDFMVELRPQDAPPLERQSFRASPLAAGMVSLHYTLSAQNLPPCPQARVSVTETSDRISNLSVASSDGGVQLEQSPLAGRPQWSVLLTGRNSPERIDLSVSYAVSDPAVWVNLSLPALRAAAAARNDAAALSLAAAAQSQASAADWPAAMQTLEQLRAYLDKLPPAVLIDSDSPDALAWNRTAAGAGSLLFSLLDFGANLRSATSRPQWALDVITWRNDLNASLLSNSDLAAKGSYKAAATGLESKAAGIRLKMVDEAGKDLAALDATYNSFMAASIDDTDRHLLDEAGRHLADAKEAISNEDGSGALLALLDARSSLDLYQSGWHAQAEQLAAQQDAQASSLASEAETAQSDLQAYSASILPLDSSKLQPLLKTADVPAWQKKLQNISALSLASAPVPKDDPLRAKLALSKREGAISSARTTLQAWRQTLNQSYKALAGGANAQYDRALSYVQDVRANAALASSPKGQKLEQDLAQLQEMMNARAWAAAIPQAEAVISSAQGLLQGAARSGGEPPWPLIGATVLLAGGVGCVLLARKKTPPKSGSGGSACHSSSPASTPSASAPSASPGPAPSPHPLPEGKKLPRQE